MINKALSIILTSIESEFISFKKQKNYCLCSHSVIDLRKLAHLDFEYKLRLLKLELQDQFHKLKRVRMQHSKEQESEKQTRNPYSTWSKEEETKLLEFILINPNDVIDGPKKRVKMIPELCKYIQSNKTEKNCKRKIDNLLKDWKTYGELVDALQKSTEVEDKWI